MGIGFKILYVYILIFIWFYAIYMYSSEPLAGSLVKKKILIFNNNICSMYNVLTCPVLKTNTCTFL